MTIAFDDVPAELRPVFAQVRHLIGCYQRYFVGRPRPATDLLHLREIVDRLGELGRRAFKVRTLRDAISARRKLLRVELGACEAELRQPRPATEQASFLAARANQQFLLYQRHLSGRARATRRPRLVQRMLTNLIEILDEMKALAVDELAKPDEHATNQALVERQIALVGPEYGQIIAERQPLSRDELVRRLGADANAEIIAQRKDAATADLETLCGRCDRLGELLLQMAGLADEGDEDTINLANVRLASRNLAAYELAFAQLVGLQPTN